MNTKQRGAGVKATTQQPVRASDFIREHGMARRHALEFLSNVAIGLGNAYAISVSSSGIASIQGEPGTLANLVERWDAKPSDHQSEDWRAWETTARLGVHEVQVRLIEETNDEFPALVAS